jgi:hypothetical protein
VIPIATTNATSDAGMLLNGASSRSTDGYSGHHLGWTPRC